MTALVYEPAGDHAVFTINRPDQLNALNLRFWEELGEAVAAFDADPRLRAGILTGAGRAFSAGRDLRELAALAREGKPVEPVPVAAREMLSRSPKPFIAAINGPAVGGGLERALDCDIRLAAPGAYFSLPEPSHGLVAAYAVERLMRTLPSGTAMLLLLTGERLSADQALAAGLVQEVVAPDHLLERAVELAGRIASSAPLAVEITKRAALASRDVSVEAARAVVAAAQGRMAEDRARRLGASGWSDRREPEASGGSARIGA